MSKFTSSVIKKQMFTINNGHHVILIFSDTAFQKNITIIKNIKNAYFYASLYMHKYINHKLRVFIVNTYTHIYNINIRCIYTYVV